MRIPLKLSSVRVRLTLWNVGILALTLLAFGGALRYALQASLQADVDYRLFSQAYRIRGAVAEHLASSQLPAPERRSYRPAVLSLDGRPLAFFSVPQPWDRAAFALSAQGRNISTTVRRAGETLRVLSVPLDQDEEPPGVIQAVAPITDDVRQVASLTRVLLTLTPLALLAAGIGGAFLTGRALRPIRDISNAAGRIEAANLSGRLPVKGGDELAELAATFNAMLGRLEDAFTRLTEANERQRRFTADASHELRTPLTVIKANTSLALMASRTAAEYRSALIAVDRSADRTEKIVHDLLLLARVDAGQLTLRHTVLGLRGVVEAAREASVPPSSAPVTVDIGEALAVSGDANTLGRLFGNLLFNAAQHTPPDGRITVSAVNDGGQIAISVADTGPGIPPEHLPHLGERFYRVDAARSRDQGGTGLGLAICIGIAEAHGGTLHISSDPGEGTRVIITLPSAPEIQSGADAMKKLHSQGSVMIPS